MKKNVSRSLIASLFVVVSPFSHAKVDVFPSQQGFSGLIFTPNAQVLTTGRFNVSFAQGIPHEGGASFGYTPEPTIANIDSWFFNAGVFPHLEAGGRIVIRDYDSGSDLSASAKLQFPYLYDLTGFNLAIGAQDIGGAASNFNAYYLVADKEIESLNLRISAGIAKSELNLGVLDGPFGGIEWQPLSFLQLAGEYDAQEFNSSLRLMTPKGLLPLDAQIAGHYQIYSSHENQELDLWGINASVPFAGETFTHQDYARNQPDSLTQLKSELKQHESSSLNQLLNTLGDEGFVNIRIGSHAGALLVALENKRYSHNPIDGAGVALGIIATYAGEGTFADLFHHETDEQPIKLVLLQNKVPMFSIDTEANCYREFLLSSGTCQQTQFSTVNLTSTLEQADWRYEVVNNGLGYSELIFAPAMRYGIATEYGFFDYSLALSSNLYTPLWKGAAIDIRHLLPVANSDDFDDGYFQNQAFESEIDYALLHQAFRLPANTLTQFSVGYINSGYYGAHNETQWHSESGQHNLGFEYGYFQPKDSEYDVERTPFLAHYRYSMAKWNWQFTVKGGQFWQGDRGIKATTSHWLGDTRIDASYLNSDEEQFVTLNVSIPLTLWREMTPGYLQVRGKSEWNFDVQTRVGEVHNQLNTGLGWTTNFYHDLDRQYLGRARLSPDYFESNTLRLKNAYMRYLDEVLNKP
ncbi:YjbH domain-containing protein [Vibrio breoganii]